MPRAAAAEFQFTRLLRGATDAPGFVQRYGLVSIHAPLARRDLVSLMSFAAAEMFQFTRLLRGATINAARSSRDLKFQFTRLLRGATRSSAYMQLRAEVSIHAPLARRDNMSCIGLRILFGFNSRASCEARRLLAGARLPPRPFQFTRLLRGATRFSKRF